ncbi:HNH endonuclease [Streptomyces sp. NPDC091416]|uniref:HNH endonuclease n=1 Tax=Streptomyces sp. NPDC091416 TaxID=3366003 RepID=UPI00380D523D
MHWKQQHGTRKRYRIDCAWCGKEHETPRENGRYCSHTCVRGMQNYEAGTNVSQLPQSHPAMPERIPNRTSWPSCRVFLTTCTICKKLFATPYTISTCSTPCTRAKRRATRREEEHRRRARERQAFVAPVDRQRIFERDRWRCHICNKKIRRTAHAPHPLSPSIDHVIPLAVGGTHEPANVRAAHFLCNALKSDRGGNEQLMLIG